MNYSHSKFMFISKLAAALLHIIFILDLIQKEQFLGRTLLMSWQKEKKTWLSSAQKQQISVHTLLAKTSHMVNPDVNEAKKHNLPTNQGSKCLNNSPLSLFMSVDV